MKEGNINKSVSAATLKGSTPTPTPNRSNRKIPHFRYYGIFFITVKDEHKMLCIFNPRAMILIETTLRTYEMYSITEETNQNFLRLLICVLLSEESSLGYH